MRKIIFLLFIALVFVSNAAGSERPEISFGLGDEVSVDLSVETFMAARYPLLDTKKYSKTAGKYLISDAAVTLKTGDVYRLMLTCTDSGGGGAKSIQLIAADERHTPASIIQRVKLGDGLAPQMMADTDDNPATVMFRVIRTGNNTEANIFSVNHVTGRLSTEVTVKRDFPAKMKIDIKCALELGGKIKIECANPKKNQIIDLSSVLEYLIEDEIYQPDGEPVPALVNLRLTRGGWEEERIYSQNGETVLDVGMSLMTLSKKPVIDATAVLKQDKSGHWAVVDLLFEPSMPYMDE